MDKNVIVIGAGGHGRVVSEIISACGDKVVGFIDDNSQVKVYGNYLGDINSVDSYSDCFFIIAIGDNRVRHDIALKHPNLKFYTAIHPSAVISPTASIGAGTCVMPNATVNSMAKIGEHCIINSNSVVEHDCKISDFVHISPNATVCGTVSIGEMSHIGSGASTVGNIKICAGVIIGTGGAVHKDITESGTYVGVPVHKVSK